MNLSAIYHTATDNFCYPLNEDELVIKIQTGYDVDRVELVYGDPFSCGLFGGGDGWKGDLLEITDVMNLQYHKIWQVVVKPAFKRCRYFFVLHSGSEVYYMLEDSFKTADEFKNYKGRRQDFFFPWMNKVDIIKPSKWVNDTVWYQIFPDRFCNSGRNCGDKYKPWASANKKVSNADSYGGDLQGVISKLDYLKDLGVSGIYFTPINESSSVHKYNTSDYKKIDSSFGTDDDIKQLVKEAHSRGIRIMLDGVFNHSGVDFMPWQDVLKNGENSRYFNWFMVNKLPIKKSRMDANARNGVYYTFGFYDYMPKLNTNNQEVVDYLIEACVKWVKEYDIDAIRLDVADEISHDFNKQLRKAMFSLKPDFYICGETWHNSMAWLRGDEFDSVMNYSLQESIDSFWNNTDTTAKDFENRICGCLNMYPKQVNEVMFNLLDSHDTMRLINRSDNDEDVFYQKLCALFTMNGTTCIYYGTEIALKGGYDPDCRRCMPWNDIESGVYTEKIATMKQIIQMRKDNNELKNGDIRFINSGNDRVVVYDKYSEDSIVRVILNCSNKDFVVDEKYSDVIFGRKFEGNVVKPKGFLVVRI